MIPYILKHKRDSREITCYTVRQLLNAYYYQWRDSNGSIPWEVFYNGEPVFYISHEGVTYNFH